MANRFKDLKWWQKLSVFGAIASILGILQYLFGFVWTVLGWLWSVLEALAGHLMSPIGWPFWVFYALLALIVVLMRKVMVTWLNDTAVSNARLKPFMYIEDTFFGVVWRWQYPSERFLRPEEFVAFCPICDLELLKTQFEPHVIPVTLYCDKCSKPFTIESESVSEILDYMVREIERRIRSGEWKERLSSGAVE